MSKGFWIGFTDASGKYVTRNTWEKDSAKWPKGACAIPTPGCFTYAKKSGHGR